jgi:hypothetical protein
MYHTIACVVGVVCSGARDEGCGLGELLQQTEAVEEGNRGQYSSVSVTGLCPDSTLINCKSNGLVTIQVVLR